MLLVRLGGTVDSSVVHRHCSAFRSDYKGASTPRPLVLGLSLVCMVAACGGSTKSVTTASNDPSGADAGIDASIDGGPTSSTVKKDNPNDVLLRRSPRLALTTTAVLPAHGTALATVSTDSEQPLGGSVLVGIGNSIAVGLESSSLNHVALSQPTSLSFRSPLAFATGSIGFSRWDDWYVALHHRRSIDAAISGDGLRSASTSLAGSYVRPSGVGVHASVSLWDAEFRSGSNTVSLLESNASRLGFTVALQVPIKEAPVFVELEGIPFCDYDKGIFTHCGQLSVGQRVRLRDGMALGFALRSSRLTSDLDQLGFEGLAQLLVSVDGAYRLLGLADPASGTLQATNAEKAEKAEHGL